MSRHYQGRPRCKKICCSEEGEKVVVEMYALGISTKEIGKSLGVSDQHIRDRMHLWEVKLKNRGRYTKKKSGESRKGVLWYLSDEELFNTPLKELAFKYHLSMSGVVYVRKRRRRRNGI